MAGSDWIDDLARFVCGLQAGRDSTITAEQAEALTTTEVFSTFTAAVERISTTRHDGQLITGIKAHQTGELTARRVSLDLLSTLPQPHGPGLAFIVGSPSLLPGSTTVITERRARPDYVDLWVWQGGRLSSNVALAPMLTVVHRRHGRDVRDYMARVERAARGKLAQDMALIRLWLLKYWTRLAPKNSPERDAIQILVAEEAVMTLDHLWAIVDLIGLDGIDATTIIQWARDDTPLAPSDFS